MSELTTEQLVLDWIAAKAAEDAATARRVEIGSVLAGALEHPEDGSKSHDIGDWRVTVKGVVNRKVDFAAIEALDLPNPPIKMRPELDTAGMKWYRDEQPDVYLRLAKCITATPGRPGITITKKESK